MANVPTTQGGQGTAASTGRRILRKLTKWFIFSILLGLLSLLSDGIILWFSGNQVSSIDLTSRGEVIIISLALVAAGMGELIFDRNNPGLMTLPSGLALGLSIVFLILLALCYGAIKFSSLRNGNTNTSVSHIAVLRLDASSWWILLFSAIMAVTCVILSEL